MKIFSSLTPKKMLLIDGAGALLSAIFLGAVLVRLESFFGIPKTALYILASVAVVFFLYDVASYYLVKGSGAFHLKIIAIANLAYCFLSFGVAVYHYQMLTLLGWIYIGLEILILLILARVECGVAVGSEMA